MAVEQRIRRMELIKAEYLDLLNLAKTLVSEGNGTDPYQVLDKLVMLSLSDRLEDIEIALDRGKEA